MINQESGRDVPSRRMATLACVAVAIYLVYGVIGSVRGSGIKEAWLYPLPVIVAVSLGMAVVRYRRG